MPSRQPLPAHAPVRLLLTVSLLWLLTGDDVARGAPGVIEQALGRTDPKVIADGKVVVSKSGTVVGFWEGSIDFLGETTAVTKRGTLHVVHNGVSGPEGISATLPALSADGNRCAYLGAAVGPDGDFFPRLVVDGRSYRPRINSWQIPPIFSADGRTLVYAARTPDDRWRTFHGDWTSDGYDGIKDLAVSPDGSRVAFAGKRGKKWRLVVDDREREAEWDGVGNDSIIFSPDGRRVAYATNRGKGAWYVTVDDKEYGPYTGLRPPGVVFSPDSKHAVWAATPQPEPHGSTIVVGANREVQTGGPVVYFDGERQPYAVDGDFHFLRAANELLYAASAGGDAFIVRDGEPGKEGFDGIKLLTVPHSARDANDVAFAALDEEDGWYVVHGKDSYGPYDDVTHISLSDDGQHIAFAALVDDNKCIVNHDGKIGGKHDQTLSLAISPGGDHCAYWAKLKDHCFLVKDEKAGKGYDGMLPGARIVWTSNESLLTYGYVGGAIWRLSARTDGQMPDALPAQQLPRLEPKRPFRRN